MLALPDRAMRQAHQLPLHPRALHSLQTVLTRPGLSHPPLRLAFAIVSLAADCPSQQKTPILQGGLGFYAQAERYTCAAINPIRDKAAPPPRKVLST